MSTITQELELVRCPQGDGVHALLSLDVLDELEQAMMLCPAVEAPVTHTFTPGLYCRTIFFPAGCFATSKIHLTEHPFVLAAGSMMVWMENEGWKRVDAPFMGITKPGTRRLGYMLTDCIWTTFHATTLTDVDEIEREIILKHDEHLAGLVQPPAAPAALE